MPPMRWLFIADSSTKALEGSLAFRVWYCAAWPPVLSSLGTAETDNSAPRELIDSLRQQEQPWQFKSRVYGQLGFQLEGQQTIEFAFGMGWE
jgi:hypothetical protein